MSGNNEVVEAWSYDIEVLTPLHIGSGEVYNKGVDFFARDSEGSMGATLQVLPRNWMRYFESILSPKLINELAEAITKERVKQWLERGGHIKRLKRYTLHLTSEEAQPRFIREQIRGGLGAPMLPGSSLKGAMRTAVICHLFDKKEVNNSFVNYVSKLRKLKTKRFSKNELSRVAEPFLQEVLGSDPKYNLMRTLRVGDVSFEKKNLALHKVKTLSLNKANEFVPKTFLNVVEGLCVGARASGMLSFDRFLQDKGQEKSPSPFNFRVRLEADTLLGMLRALAMRFLEQEETFLRDKKGQNITEMRSKIAELRGMAGTLGKDETIFHCGWGTGWKGMTGGLLTENDLAAERGSLRKKLVLADKRLDFPFPKTRRVVISGGMAWPMGWVKLRLHPAEAEEVCGEGRE